MSGPLLRCTLWCRRLLSYVGGRRGGLSKKYDDEEDALESGGGAGAGGAAGGNSFLNREGGGASSFWQDAQRMLKLFVFSLLVLLLVTPDTPRWAGAWAGARVAPTFATLACGMGGAENTALCEENFGAAIKGEDPVAVASATGASSDAVDCAETCKDEIAAAAEAATGVDMGGGGGAHGGSAAAIIRGAGLSDCKPMKLNCTELEDELWGRINSLVRAVGRVALTPGGCQIGYGYTAPTPFINRRLRQYAILGS
jgi:hypothetical protein